MFARVWQRVENFLPESGLEESNGQSRGLQLRSRLAYTMADGMAGHFLVLPPSASWGGGAAAGAGASRWPAGVASDRSGAGREQPKFRCTPP